MEERVRNERDYDIQERIRNERTVRTGVSIPKKSSFIMHLHRAVMVKVIGSY